MATKPFWRKAASVLIAAPSGLPGRSFDYKLCFVRRAESARLFPRSLVFPGGKMEESDLALARQLAREHEDVDLMAAKICAVREVAEETGILLGHEASTVPIAERSNFPFTPRSLRSAVDVLQPFCTWLSPEYIAASPQGGFETNFFVAILPAPPTGTPAADGEEVTEIRWMSPADAVKAADDARFPFPQLYMLGELMGCHKRLLLASFVLRLHRGLFRYPFKPFRFNTVDDKCIFVLPGDHQHPIYRPIKFSGLEHRGLFEGTDFRNSKWSLSRSDELVRIASSAGEADLDWCSYQLGNNSKL